MFFHPLFQPALVRWLGSRHRCTSPTTSERKHKCRDCHADCCENRCDGNSLLTKQGANALSQFGVFMEEPPECLTESVDLGTEGCSVRGEGFEPCLSLKLDVREYTLELSDSISNLSLHFSVVREPSVFGAPVRGVFRPRIFGRRYSSALPGCLPTHFSLPSLPFRAQPALFWVTHTVSIGRSSIVVRVLSSCSAL